MVTHDVIFVAPVERMGAQGIVEIRDHVKVFGAVEVIQVQPSFHKGNAVLGQR